MTSIGIDFGTTNSAVARYSSGGAEVIPVDSPPSEWSVLGFDQVLPSVVAVDEDGRLMFGWEAKTSKTKKRFPAVKRLFLEDERVEAGGQEFLVEEVATALFSHIKRKVREQGIEFQSAVITIPANSRGLARYRTKICAGMAEIAPMALVNEPTAAAMGYGIDASYDQTILVFDFGGGTLDITVLETVGGTFIEQGSRGVTRLGGLDFDHLVLRRIAEESPGANDWTFAQKQELLLQIEQAKVRLSDQEETQIVCDAVPRGYRLTRPLFNEVTRHLLSKVGAPVEQCLRDLHMAPNEIDHLLLVGGMSKVPAVRALVSGIVGRDPAVGVDPLTAVASGAAVAAAILNGEVADSDFFVSTEHALGTVVARDPGGDIAFSPIIPRNQKLPAKASEVYSPVADYQEEVTIQVMEGDPELQIDHEDNVLLAAFDVPFDPPRPAAEAGFTLTYSYDTDGILSVEVQDALSGESLSAPLALSFHGARDSSELVGIAKSVKGLVEGDDEVRQSSRTSPATDPETALLLQRARTKVIPFLDEEEAGELRTLADSLEAAIPEERGTIKGALEEALRKYSYLF